jgi:hypothetical protein
MELTPEQRQKIYEEERVRAQARSDARNDAIGTSVSRFAKMFVFCVFGVLILCWIVPMLLFSFRR